MNNNPEIEILRDLLQNVADRIHMLSGPHETKLRQHHGRCQNCGKAALVLLNGYAVICWGCFSESKNTDLYLRRRNSTPAPNEVFVDEPGSHERVNPSKRKQTSSFEEAIRKFQGKHQKTFPEELLKSLGALEVKTKSSFLKHMKKMKTCREYYDDIHLIHSVVTGVPCADISVYENLLISSYRTAVENYSGRPSAWYFLYRLLNHIGYVVVPSDIPNMTEVTKEKVSPALRRVPSLVINTTNGRIKLSPNNHENSRRK